MLKLAESKCLPTEAPAGAWEQPLPRSSLPRVHLAVQEARGPEILPGESGRAKTEYCLFLASQGQKSCGPQFLMPALFSPNCPAFPPHSRQHSEMPVCPSTLPPLIHFMNLVGFIHKVGCFIPMKWSQSHRQGDLGEMSPV